MVIISLFIVGVPKALPSTEVGSPKVEPGLVWSKCSVNANLGEPGLVWSKCSVNATWRRTRVSLVKV